MASLTRLNTGRSSGCSRGWRSNCSSGCGSSATGGPSCTSGTSGCSRGNRSAGGGSGAGGWRGGPAGSTTSSTRSARTRSGGGGAPYGATAAAAATRTGPRQGVTRAITARCGTWVAATRVAPTGSMPLVSSQPFAFFRVGGPDAPAARAAGTDERMPRGLLRRLPPEVEQQVQLLPHAPPGVYPDQLDAHQQLRLARHGPGFEPPTDVLLLLQREQQPHPSLGHGARAHVEPPEPLLLRHLGEPLPE